jgi:hypothetical protein
MPRSERDIQNTTGSASATYSSGSGTAKDMHTDSTFDGYTLQQVVRALKEQGVLE